MCSAITRRPKFLRPIVRRAIVLGSLLAIVAATIGVPIVRPVRGPGGKDVSRPFPCMESACGCMDAEACWQSCCCHTHAERLAWARKHLVTPPEFVVDAAPQQRVERPAAGACCSTTCCESAGKLADEHGQATVEDHWKFSFVPALSSRCCHGLPHLWLILSSALPPPKNAAWQPDEPICEPLFLAEALAASTCDAPPTPPPNA